MPGEIDVLKQEVRKRREVWRDQTSRGIMLPERCGDISNANGSLQITPPGPGERCTARRPHSSLKGVRGEALCSI